MNGPPHSARPRAHGFTLVEIAVVLVIISVLIAMAAMMTRGVVAAQNRSLTASRLAAVDAAIAQFVSQSRRLPCPALGTLTSADADWGKEVPRDPAAGCATQTDGVVPWMVLGLTEADVTDGWGRRITYRAFPILTADNGMNLSWCDPAGGAGTFPGPGGLCNPNCSALTMVASCTRPDFFLSGKGLLIKTQGGVGATTLMDPGTAPYSGAAYVLISHGPSGGGARMSSGVMSASTAPNGDGTDEANRNYANLAIQLPPNAYYVDDVINETATALHFDDILSRPAILSVAARAGLSPRAHN